MSAGIKQELHTTEMDFPLPVLNFYHADAPVCTVHRQVNKSVANADNTVPPHCSGLPLPPPAFSLPAVEEEIGLTGRDMSSEWVFVPFRQNNQ